MVRRVLVVVVTAGVTFAAAAQELAEYAQAELALAKRLLVRHKITDVAFLRKDRGMVAIATPAAALHWSSHKSAEAPWTFTERVPLRTDAEAVRPLIDTRTSPVPESALQESFERLKSRREEARVRYVFVPRAPANLSPRNAARHLDKFRRAVARNTPFDALVAEYSSHPSAANGGDLGFIARSAGVLPAEVESFVFSAEAGQTSRIFETPSGAHLVRVEERRSPSIESMRAELGDLWLSERLTFASSRQIVAIAANARRIAVASGYVVVLYDVSDATNAIAPVFAFVEPRTVDAVALTSGGNIVAIASGGEVVIRRLKQGATPEPIQGTGRVDSLLFSPNAASLAISSGENVDIASISDRAVVASVPISAPLAVAAFSPDSRLLVTGDSAGRVQMWDAMTFERVRNGEPGYDARYWTQRTWMRTAEKQLDSAPVCFAFHPSGRLFVAGLRSGHLQAFALPDGGRMPIGPAQPHNASLIRASFSDDGRVLVTAAEDDTIGVWTVPQEFERGPRPRPRTFDELVAQHREVVRVHAEFKGQREKMLNLQSDYDNQATYLRERINGMMTQQNLPNWRALERRPEGNALLRGLQSVMGYRDELEAAIEALRAAMVDLEDIARLQVIEIKARRVLDPEQFERFAQKLAEVTAKAPSGPDPTIAPKRVPSFDRVWEYVLTGDLKGTS